MSAPRRACPVCSRDIAVVAGRYARHDPPGRRQGGELVSCPGSLKAAQADALRSSAELFHDEPAEELQQRLF